MGLFGFGKKKKQTNAADEVFKQYGLETNDAKSPEKQTRREAAEAVANARESQNKKDNILERMNSLRKLLYRKPEFDRYSALSEECIQKLKGMPDNANKAAMASVDNFLLAAANEAVNYANRGNYIAMGSCIDIIDSLVNDRFQCGEYYTDPQFCRFKLERNRFYVEQQNQQSEYEKLEKRMAQLKEDAQNPDLKLSKENIAREAMRIKSEGQRIRARLDKLEAQMQLLDKSLNEIISHSTAHAHDGLFDLQGEMDDILAMKRENEHDESMVDKLNEKMDESHRKVSSAELGVNEDALGQSGSVELSDDLFRM